MANVKYFAGFNNLNNWPGNLFENREGDSTLTVKTATNLTITHGPTHPFAGFKLVFAGTGLVYDGNDVVDGTISSLTIRNAANQTILQITGLSSTSIASDIVSLLPAIMGWTEPNNNFNSDGKMAWAQLMSGNDVITGTAGDDRSLVGVDGGNDTYNMGLGDDHMNGGIGNDTYNGGDGRDTLSFTETSFNEGITATRGINVNMATGVVLDAWGGTDTIDSVEQVFGSRFKDVFVGGNDRDIFAGLRGADSFDGGGHDGDRVRYDEDVWHGGARGINANLSTGIIVDGFGTRDTVVNIEQVLGTRFNDVFVGNSARNMFAGGEGDDSYNGGTNATGSAHDGDAIDFGWWFTDSPSTGINVNLALATNQIINDGFGNTETAIGIETVFGTDANDIIRGNGAKNKIAGGDGLDTMTGGAGADVFEFWGQNHAGDGDVITDFNTTQDELAFDSFAYNNMTGTAIVENDMNAATANGTFLFNTTTKILYWDENGSGAGGQFAIVKLTGVASLSASNFDLYT